MPFTYMHKTISADACRYFSSYLQIHASYMKIIEYILICTALSCAYVCLHFVCITSVCLCMCIFCMYLFQEKLLGALIHTHTYKLCRYMQYMHNIQACAHHTCVIHTHTCASHMVHAAKVLFMYLHVSACTCIHHVCLILRVHVYMYLYVFVCMCMYAVHNTSHHSCAYVHLRCMCIVSACIVTALVCVSIPNFLQKNGFFSKPYTPIKTLNPKP
jgi:hypothetical protein